jgi:hypothetical protein
MSRIVEAEGLALIICIEKGETEISLQMFKAMDDLCKQQRRLKPRPTTCKRMRKQLRYSLVGMVEPTQDRRSDYAATLDVQWTRCLFGIWDLLS